VSLKQIARGLRRNQTDEEKRLWRALRGRRFAGFKFRRQHEVGDYILDFYCAAAELTVELDGSQHGYPEGMQRDAAREEFLTKRGIVRCGSGTVSGVKIVRVVCGRSGISSNKDPAAYA